MEGNEARRDASLEDALGGLLTEIPSGGSALYQRARAIADWEALFGLAHDHGVGGLLVHALQSEPDIIPAPVLRAQRHKIFALSGWQTYICRILTEVLAVLEEARVPVVPLKGPFLAERYYPDPRLRRSEDLDVLVAPKDLGRARAALARIGFAKTKTHSPLGLSEPHHEELIRDGFALELHFRATSGFTSALPTEALMSRARPARRRDGSLAWTLSPEDELLYLIVHAQTHTELRYAWFVDMKLLLAAHPELDWAVLFERARGYRLERSLAFGLASLASRLGVPLPERARATPMLSASRRAALELLVRTASGRRSEDPITKLSRFASWLLLCDHGLDVLRVFEEKVKYRLWLAAQGT